ncbi:DUF2237 domain-containing protein [Lentisphaera profundi]|uniref:DUF2237 domain-containing protein n=1 Tax=Lentisphaera profundi TaxID=1658616 RepID=A0ABY7VS85_9BACT|nr:DUF2237 domain-containing protein [Lentisphaera profundi]WDE97070.1 DUF2237 domain-containing protein [Lentisphaera profundi]
MSNQLNVLGTALEACCTSNHTGFYRDGYCYTGPMDMGSHTVCCYITQEFLEYSKNAGNDLSTAVPEYNFPGLSPGDKWCVCALRWLQAEETEKAPPIILEASNARCLEVISLELIKLYAYKK